MAKQSKGRPAATAAASRARPSRSAAIAPTITTGTKKRSASPSLSVPALLPNALVLLTAFAGVALELTTSAQYAQSKELMSLLKKCFIAFVCLTSRVQLATLFFPPNKPKTLRVAVYGHCKALLVAILANSAGTTVIRPLFGAAPQYEETVQLVVPIYFLVEIVIAVLRVPLPVLNCVVGLCVSWLKAVTISKMVAQWQSTGVDAHPIGFVLVSTANLFASGLVLRYIKHYHQSNKLIELSFGVVWSLVRMLLVSGAIGLVAHVATHFMTQQERQLEAMALNFLVAWFALDKYWKGPLTVVLTLATNAFARNTSSKKLKIE
ncbi:hypothetical protein Gpo141_00001503 [Globisporangium polare]